MLANKIKSFSLCWQINSFSATWLKKQLERNLLFCIFSISCTAPFSNGGIYNVTGPLSEGFMPEVWISKLVVLLTEEDMSLTVFCYCIFNCAHRCCSFKTVFKSFVFITFYLSYVAVSRPCCLLKFYPKNRALSKTGHYHLNSVHAKYRRTLITWTWITQIPH